VGRSAAAGTDVRLTSEILSYSRTKGIFAGISLDGAVVQADRSGDESMYGAGVDRHQILSGSIPTPLSAMALARELNAYGDVGNVAGR
jgi:lipid-binding SYLF domain-containing protein